METMLAVASSAVVTQGVGSFHQMGGPVERGLTQHPPTAVECCSPARAGVVAERPALRRRQGVHLEQLQDAQAAAQS